MTRSISVLIPDCDDWSTLRVVRCLGTVPTIKTHILSNKRYPMPRFSRFCGPFYYHRSINDSDWLDTIKTLAKRWNIDVIMPTTLRGIMFVSQNREAISEIAAVVPLAKTEMITMANDKWAFYKFINKNELPSMPTVYVGKAGEAIRMPKNDSTKYPALLKPTSESGGYGFVYVRDFSDLTHAWHDKRIMNGREYILQSYVPAANFSLSLCSQNGEIIAFTLNRKILSFGNPFSTKGMLEYNNNEQVIDIGKRLISAMKWDGVADVDFLIDNRDQKAKILEFNPRFWQTLLGGLTAGVNFPLIWCLSALGIKQSSKQHTTTKYVGSPLLFIKMMFSKLIGKHAIISARWYESCFQFICNDPLPELIEVLRRMGRKKWLPLQCLRKRQKAKL